MLQWDYTEGTSGNCQRKRCENYPKQVVVLSQNVAGNWEREGEELKSCVIVFKKQLCQLSVSNWVLPQRLLLVKATLAVHPQVQFASQRILLPALAYFRYRYLTIPSIIVWKVNKACQEFLTISRTNYSKRCKTRCHFHTGPTSVLDISICVDGSTWRNILSIGRRNQSKLADC